jgi:photosystem II stability/assembly factor-like uncharacterized protein
MIVKPLLISTRKGLFEAHHDGARYVISAPHFGGIQVSFTMVDPRDGAWYAALNHGHFGVKLHRSDDRGATWIELAAPTYPPRPEDAPIEKNYFGKEVEWATKLIWSMVPALDAPGALWAGTSPGGLFRSDDRGATWRLIESLWNHPLRKKWMGGGMDFAGIHSIMVDPRDPRMVVIAVSCGGVWRTRDLGETWEMSGPGLRSEYMPPEQAFDMASQDPHCVVQCQAVPTTFWCQHHNGIFVSTDDLASWQEIKQAGPSVFGFPVTVDPQDPNTVWFVPAQKDEWRIPVDGQLCVTRTSDGGATFEILRHGLPNNAYDLVLRHGLALSGDSIAFGSTTGNAFVSFDRGQSFQVISNYLPPVYAVAYC